MRKPTWASALPSCLGSVACVTSQDPRAAGNTVRLSPALGRADAGESTGAAKQARQQDSQKEG